MVRKAGVRKKAVKSVKKSVKKPAKKKAVDPMAKYHRKGSTMSGYKYGARHSPGGKYKSTYRAGRSGKKPSRGE